MNELTLLEALHKLRIHKSKRQRLIFKVTFDEGITRTARFGKYWNKVMKSWTYVVQDGDHTPSFAYSERLAVSAIMINKGMDLYFNSIRYHVLPKNNT
ncbi:MAG: hypothetical protein IJE78_09860 [Bacteroidaceae bacterium]|nr:hypothetical protein [Bacteroidaceae bacterium]